MREARAGRYRSSPAPDSADVSGRGGFRRRLWAGSFLEFHFGLWALALPVVLAVIAILLGEMLNEDSLSVSA
jgi:hypothetical protein